MPGSFESTSSWQALNEACTRCLRDFGAGLQNILRHWQDHLGHPKGRGSVEANKSSTVSSFLVYTVWHVGTCHCYWFCSHVIYRDALSARLRFKCQVTMLRPSPRFSCAALDPKLSNSNPAIEVDAHVPSALKPCLPIMPMIWLWLRPCMSSAVEVAFISSAFRRFIFSINMSLHSSLKSYKR